MGRMLNARKMVSDEERKQIAQEYATGEYAYLIAARHATTETTVCRIARQMGVPPHGRGGRKGKQDAVYARK